MLHRKPTRWNRLLSHRPLRILAEMAAGLDAASGIAHGIEPPPTSLARRRPDPGP